MLAAALDDGCVVEENGLGVRQWGVTERAHQGRRVVRWHDGFNVGEWSCVSPDVGGGALGRWAPPLGAGALAWVAVHGSSSVSSSSGRRPNARAS